jgi:hypothetical protein
MTCIAISKRPRRTVALLLVGILANAGIFVQQLTAAPAQDEQAVTWDRLPTRAKGTRLRMTLTDRAVVTGHLVEARADAVVLEDVVALQGRLQGPQTFLRSNVASILVLKGRSKVKWIGIASGIAAGVAGLLFAAWALSAAS